MKSKAYLYEIRVEETLQGGCLDWFPSWEATTGEQNGDGGCGPCTLLRSAATDQTALFGVLAAIRDLNLTLISVRRLPESSSKDSQ